MTRPELSNWLNRFVSESAGCRTEIASACFDNPNHERAEHDPLEDRALLSSFRRRGLSNGMGAVVLLRDDADDAFEPHDRDLLHTFHCEIGPWLWEAMSLIPRDPGSGRQDLLNRLSPAQRVVLPYLLEGLTEAEIARRLFRSRHTIHDHARAIYAALGVSNRIELVLAFSDSRPSAVAGAVTSPSP